MKIYTVAAGVNGVGKSSFLGVIKAERNDLGCVVNNPVKAGRQAVRKINAAIEQGLSFTQETTLSGHFIKNTLKTAREHGYFIRMFYVGLNSYNECVKRIKNRVEKGGHDIAESDVRRRYGRRFDDLLRALPYCDEAFLFDNENGFAEVGEYKNGELIVKGTYKPEWLRELETAMR